jgi:hypothetical protein
MCRFQKHLIQQLCIMLKMVNFSTAGKICCDQNRLFPHGWNELLGKKQSVPD